MGIWGVVAEPFRMLSEVVVTLLYAFVKTHTAQPRSTAHKLYPKNETKSQYLVLGPPLPFPDVSGDDSFGLLSQPGVGAELEGKQSGGVGWVLVAWAAK